ncbi:sugar 3,4-ketoisomerase [Croceiramulus getboli]|nr:FdtA/QdtA family cupin domain-containing protein [Flavobacteriaceae bacterium YJPT1-3]
MKTTKISDCIRLSIPKIEDPRGNLAVIEEAVIPFQMQRVYYLYDIPSTAFRGGHAHIEQQEVLMAVSGSFQVMVDDGTRRKKIILNKPDEGLLIPAGIWRELEDFSSGAVCLVIASDRFDEADYLRDYDTFKSRKG